MVKPSCQECWEMYIELKTKILEAGERHIVEEKGVPPYHPGTHPFVFVEPQLRIVRKLISKDKTLTHFAPSLPITQIPSCFYLKCETNRLEVNGSF